MWAAFRDFHDRLREAERAWNELAPAAAEV
jgi:hypothetical protein